MVVIGDFSIGGTIMKADNLASTLQVCQDSGAKKVLLPQTSAVDLGTVPAELMLDIMRCFTTGLVRRKRNEQIRTDKCILCRSGG